MEEIIEKNLIKLISGSAEEIRLAKKEIHSLYNKDYKKFKSCKELLFKYIDSFDSIKADKNKAAFISGISLFYLSLADDNFDYLKNFIIKNLVNTNGSIREAARNTGDWLYISLSSRSDPFVWPEDKELTEKQKSNQVIGEKQYTDLIMEIESLLEKYDDKDDDSEYISEMKPSICKTLQTFLSRLTDTPAYRRLLERKTPITLELFNKRKEVEIGLIKMLSKSKSDYDIDDIKEIIFEEHDIEDMHELIRIFDDGNTDDLSNVLELISDAWNYFPHRVLNGQCPNEKMMKYRNGI